MKKKSSILIAFLVSFFVLTSCSEKTTEDIEKIYTINIATYQYAGTSIVDTPLKYIGEVKLITNFSLSSTLKQSEADKQAIAKFNKEMEKIDVKKLDVYKDYYILYELTSVLSEKTIAQKAFGEKD